VPYTNKDKQREYQRTWVTERRQSFFADKVCIDCGIAENLQLDHVDAQLKVSHRIWSWSKEHRDTELSKCVVRCLPCHVKKSVAVGDVRYGEQINGAHSTALVKAVRALRQQEQLSYRAIAARLNISKTTVWEMCNQTWKRLI